MADIQDKTCLDYMALLNADGEGPLDISLHVWFDEETQNTMITLRTKEPADGDNDIIFQMPIVALRIAVTTFKKLSSQLG